MALLKAFSHFSVNEIASLAHGDEIVAPASAHGFLLSTLSQSNPLLVVTTSSRAAEYLFDEVNSYLGGGALIFPPWETLPHERLSPKSDTVTKRFNTLHTLTTNPKSVKVLITSIR